MVDPKVIATHRLCSNHRALLADWENAACFYCLAVFPTAEIEDWIEEGDEEGEATAHCPRCWIDSVIPWQDWMTPAFLKAMQEHWF